MNDPLHEQLAELEEMTLDELRERYAEVCGEPTASRHKDHIRRLITWQLQAQREGGLSERARARARELARESDLRLLAPRGRTEVHRFGPGRDRRLPPPGTTLTRLYKGREVRVTVLERGFECDGEVYRSLSAVARAVTGSHWNGHLFFGLAKREGRK